MGSHEIEIVSREDWGASPRLSPASHNVSPQRGGVAIHWVGGPLRITSHAQCAAEVRSIQRDHMRSKGWVDIAYTMLACPHGKLFMGRGPGRRTAANGTNIGNQNWYAICALVGQGDAIPPLLLETLVYGVEWLREHGKAGPKVSGHRDHFATDCPGPDLYGWVNQGMPLDGKVLASKAATPAPRLLRMGSRGTDVRQWQQRLRRLGYVIAADGIYGKETAGATKRFQKRHGLDPDGIVGPLTRAKAK